MFALSISVERWHTAAAGNLLRCIQNIPQPTIFMGGAGGCSSSSSTLSCSKAIGIPIRIQSPCCSSLSTCEAFRNKAFETKHCVPRTAVGSIHDWKAKRVIACLSELRTRAATVRSGHPIRRILGQLPAPHRWYDRSKRRVGFLKPCFTLIFSFTLQHL